MLCRWVGGSRHFERPSCLQLQESKESKKKLFHTHNTSANEEEEEEEEERETKVDYCN
jgi:hypothetical protein